jgi:transcriptional regulator with XRE-family HTH domain
MAKRPIEKYDFKAFGAAIKEARMSRKESRKKVSDEMYISPRYLANIENKGQHPSLQIFFELMLRYNISVDQFLLESPSGKNTQRRQLDAVLDGMSDTGLRIVTATAQEIKNVENEGDKAREQLNNE